MPFTPSHVAAVLPFLRTPLPAAALVVGSTSPDLPYYLPFLPGAWTGSTHTAQGIVTSDLVLGLLGWLGWHGLLAGAVLHLAPRGVRGRLDGRVVVGLTPRLDSPRRAVLVVVALVVGAATHVLWDELTHAGRWGTGHLPVLRTVWAGWQGYRWAQYASGVVGGAVVGVWVLRWWRRTPPRAVPARPRSLLVWAALFGLATIVGGLDALREPEPRAAVFTGATTGGATLLAGVVVASLVLRVTGRTGRT